MTDPLRLLAVLAHPDDESLGMGGTLAKYAAEGVEIHLLTATRGQRGWFGAEDQFPGYEALGRQREAELRCAAESLGIRSVQLLDYLDGDLDQADPAEAVFAIAAVLRRLRPQVVITFGPEGAYGHPDHIAISQFTGAAIVQAANSENGLPAHCVAKLYYMVFSKSLIEFYLQATGEDICMTIDNVDRTFAPWEEWAITTRIDAAKCWQTARQAILCHASQAAGYGGFVNLSEPDARRMWASSQFYRAFSLVNGGRQLETDLFAGLR